MTSRRPTLEERIQRIKDEIAQLGELRPGSLSQQFNVCGKPGCRCKADPPRKHGPYYQVSFTFRGKSGTQFVRREDVARVKRQLRNHQRLRALVEQWINLSLESVSLDQKEGGR